MDKRSREILDALPEGVFDEHIYRLLDEERITLQEAIGFQQLELLHELDLSVDNQTFGETK